MEVICNGTKKVDDVTVGATYEIEMVFHVRGWSETQTNQKPRMQTRGTLWLGHVARKTADSKVAVRDRAKRRAK
ncbi:unnamed protein product [Linum trigynum]|uniref:Uncharacterized protein n=1 Tax=Linum trigynum TaxID=586398 RepID=A0AAV2D5Y3_9ROSI